MGRQSPAEVRFRERAKRERERRGWSQADVSKHLQHKGLAHIYPTTVAKIESGERAVRIDEATAIADLFDLSVDAMLGRRVGAEQELVQLLHAMTDAARLCTWQVSAIQNTFLNSAFRDLPLLQFDGIDRFSAEANRAHAALREAGDAFAHLQEFPLPTEASAIALREWVDNPTAQQRLLRMAERLAKDDGLPVEQAGRAAVNQLHDELLAERMAKDET